MKAAFISFAILILVGCQQKDLVQEALPIEVSVVKIIEDTVSIKKDFVGQVYGKVDIPIRARAEGYLMGIRFKEGQKVYKDSLLYTIDAQPFEAALSEANSSLAEAKVGLVRANNDVNRVKPLAEMNAVSQRDLDAAIAEQGAAEAMVSAAEANVDMMEIQLSYTRVRAPIDGLIGKSLAKIGEFVGREPNPVILNTVSRIDSIRVEFFLTESDYLLLARAARAQEAKLTLDSAEEDKAPKLPLELILADGSIFEYPGYVDFINRQVDADIGAILIQATFPNPNKTIRPGQFAKIRAIVSQMDNGLLVPQRCVQEFQGSFFVLAVDAEGLVKRQTIEIQAKYRDYFLVKKGLKLGDQVILEGLQKVSEGKTVQMKEVEFQSKFN